MRFARRTSRLAVPSRWRRRSRILEIGDWMWRSRDWLSIKEAGARRDGNIGVGYARLFMKEASAETDWKLGVGYATALPKEGCSM